MRPVWISLMLFSVATVAAVQVGDSKSAVIDELGAPRSTMAMGDREVLVYGTGKVVLTAGKVSEFSRGMSTRAPQPETTVTPKVTTKPPPVARSRKAHWYTDIGQAKAAAAKSNKRILALFTGTDWCPPCQKFEAEVAHDEQFSGIFAASFIFYKADWLRNTSQPKSVEQEVAGVLDEYDIESFPTLKVLNAEGEELDTVDWTSVRGGSFKEIMIEAIDDARIATKGGKKASSSWWPF